MIDQQEILAAVARQTETILATLESRWMRRATAVVAGSRSLASADQPPLEAALAALPSRRSADATMRSASSMRRTTIPDFCKPSAFVEYRIVAGRPRKSYQPITKEAFMKRISLALAVVALTLLAVAPVEAAVPKLVGTVGPGFTITLKKSGTKVTKLKAGKYSITVSDLSSSHNFHLTGPGVNKKTSVGGTGKSTWTVTLQKGKTYRFVCDPHASIMKGSFKTS